MDQTRPVRQRRSAIDTSNIIYNEAQHSRTNSSHPISININTNNQNSTESSRNYMYFGILFIKSPCSEQYVTIYGKEIKASAVRRDERAGKKCI